MEGVIVNVLANDEDGVRADRPLMGRTILFYFESETVARTAPELEQRIRLLIRRFPRVCNRTSRT
jgi:hypothetical protein